MVSRLFGRKPQIQPDPEYLQLARKTLITIGQMRNLDSLERAEDAPKILVELRESNLYANLLSVVKQLKTTKPKDARLISLHHVIFALADYLFREIEATQMMMEHVTDLSPAGRRAYDKAKKDAEQCDRIQGRMWPPLNRALSDLKKHHSDLYDALVDG